MTARYLAAVLPRALSVVKASDHDAEVERLREALRSIYLMPCAFPDDPDEDRKLADQFAGAQDVAHDALALDEGGE